MYKDSKKRPILEILVSTECDTLITEVYQSIRNKPICWLANEQLEYLFNGNKVHGTLWFHAANNRIEFFDSLTNQVLAKVWFSEQLIRLPKSRLQTNLELSL